jgi:Flp pilus assembly protein TadB
MVRKKKFAGQDWSSRDLALMGFFLALLAFGGLNPRFVYAALVVLAVLVAIVAVRAVRRARIGRANAKVPHWIERIK